MKNYLREIFSDILLSIVTKKYGTSLNDYQREEKADEIIQELHDKNTFTVEMTLTLRSSMVTTSSARKLLRRGS